MKTVSNCKCSNCKNLNHEYESGPCKSCKQIFHSDKPTNWEVRDENNSSMES